LFTILGVGAILLDELLVIVVKLDSGSSRGSPSHDSTAQPSDPGQVTPIEQGLLEWVSTMSWQHAHVLRPVVAAIGRLIGSGGGASGGHWRPEVAGCVGRLAEAALGACFRDGVGAAAAGDGKVSSGVQS
jgi:hypothetical protein